MTLMENQKRLVGDGLGARNRTSIIHGSDAAETALTEIKLWFKEEELVNWQPSLSGWIYE